MTEEKIKKEKYKSPKSRKIVTEIFGWIILIDMFAGIWIKEYRWQLIFTALFSIFLASMLAIVDSHNEKKFNETKGNKKCLNKNQKNFQ